MVKGKGEPCLSAVIQYRAERRPDRPADKEDTYGGYDMHFSLYTTLCPLQNVIPMLQIGFSGALRLIPTHFLRLPGIESAEETVCASRNASAVLSFAAHHCREQACPFRVLWFCQHSPVGLTTKPLQAERINPFPTAMDFGAGKTVTYSNNVAPTARIY